MLHTDLVLLLCYLGERERNWINKNTDSNDNVQCNGTLAHLAIMNLPTVSGYS